MVDLHTPPCIRYSPLSFPISTVYLGYGLFTRSDEHEHLGDSAAKVIHYGQDYLHDHAPRLNHALHEGAQGVRHAMGTMEGGMTANGNQAGGGHYLNRNDQGVYHLSFPSNSRRKGEEGHTNIFLLILYRSFSFLIVYPIFIIFNILSYSLHYVSVTLILLLWTAYYLTLPLTSFISLLSNTFLAGPASIIWGIAKFFQPLAGLLGGLMGIGAAVGGLAAWFGKMLERGIYKRAGEREEREARKREQEQEQEEREVHQAQLLRDSQAQSYGLGSGLGFGRLSKPKRWLANQLYPPQAAPPAAWADIDDQFCHSPAFPIDPSYPPSTRLVYPAPSMSGLRQTGIMKKPSYSTNISPMTPDSTPKPSFRRSRISFAEPPYSVSDNDDDFAHGLDPNAPTANPAFHFHFHTPQDDSPPTPFKRRTSNGSSNKPRVTATSDSNLNGGSNGAEGADNDAAGESSTRSRPTGLKQSADRGGQPKTEHSDEPRAEGVRRRHRMTEDEADS